MYRILCAGILPYHLCLNGHMQLLHTFRPRKNGPHFADDVFKRIFLSENYFISIQISLKYVPSSLIINMQPLSEPMGSLVNWRIYAALSPNELMSLQLWHMHHGASKLDCLFNSLTRLTTNNSTSNAESIFMPWRLHDNDEQGNYRANKLSVMRYVMMHGGDNC